MMVDGQFNLYSYKPFIKYRNSQIVLLIFFKEG